MPLLDHFHPPLKGQRHWESLHAMWIATIAEALNESWLPDGYYAEVQTHNPRVEVDIATYDELTGVRNGGAAGGDGAAMLAPPWAPPAPPLSLPTVYTETFSARVFSEDSGIVPVGAIELVSPGNKDRPNTRELFASKCLTYLNEGISLINVDVVASRRANLHNEMMRLAEAPQGFLLPAEVFLYAVAYRPTIRAEKPTIDIWPEKLEIGTPLPTMPLRLTGDLFVPVELETTYVDACRRLRVS